MARRRKPKHTLIKTLSALAVVCLFSTCASSTTDGPAGNPEVTNNPGEPTASDVALLAEPEPVVAAPKPEEPAAATSQPPATEVADPNAFADLKDGADKKEPEAAALTTASDKPAEGSKDSYYSAIGGETVKRVAFTLYSDRKFAQKLMERNPDLKGVAKLVAEQKVYFDIESSRPEPRFLTRDLIDRYPEKLAERLTSVSTEKGIGRSTASVAKGETLQAVSQRLYGTTRYWTELYLVNRDKIQNYNKVSAGITLSVFDHPNKEPGLAKAEAPETAIVANTSEESEPPKALEKEPEPLPEPVKKVEMQPPPAEVKPMAALPPPPPLPKPEPLAMPPAPPPIAAVDPIPETPPPPPVVAEKLRPLPPPMPASKPSLSMEEMPSSDANLRRFIYVGLILVIGGVAFYFTRSPKRPKLDILDMTADGTARPKLSSKDSQKHNIG